MNFYQWASEPEYEDCFAGTADCGCTAQGLSECEVRRARREDLAGRFRAEVLEDAETGLDLATTYGPQDTLFGSRPARYPDGWSWQTLAVVRLAVAKRAEFGRARRRAEPAKGNAPGR